MVNNCELIKDLLIFDDLDTFYVIQIIKRRKENPGLKTDSKIIKVYYVHSKEYLDTHMPEIILLCDFHNARAYINLNRRSYKKLSYEVLKKLVDQLVMEDYKSISRVFDKVAGKYSSEPNKKWVLDLDTPEQLTASFLEEIRENLEQCRPLGPKILAVIPTKSGAHVITKPFDLSQFEHVRTMDIHKDNPTVLYVK